MENDIFTTSKLMTSWIDIKLVLTIIKHVLFNQNLNVEYIEQNNTW
jgi:hypothetical protein